MSDSEKPKKPTPSLEELNAYLEQSAARTKKRLPLAGMGEVPKVSRALPTVGAPKKANESPERPVEKKS